MVAVVVFEFSGMRCQPLRRALCVFLESFHTALRL
ncbi:acetyltransferase [Vibrio cholerae]|nr:acetyltransferase [Vibrio cholerae]EJR0943163.1 acetyltransferase [Vibrio cholerae]EKF9865093.1 acetyltransferase [Vibrio cholerae]